MFKKITVILGLLLMHFLPFSVATATVSLPDEYHPIYAPAVNIGAGANEADYGNYYLQLIAGGLLYLAAPIAVFMIAFQGSSLVTAAGDETKITEAKKGITYSAIGLIVVMLSFAIVKAAITLTASMNAVK